MSDSACEKKAVTVPALMVRRRACIGDRKMTRRTHCVHLAACTALMNCFTMTGASASDPPDPARTELPTLLQRNAHARRAAQPPSLSCSKSESPVRLRSPEAVRTAGLEFVTIKEEPLTATIIRNAELESNANRYVRLSPRAGGVICEVRRGLARVSGIRRFFESASKPPIVRSRVRPPGSSGPQRCPCPISCPDV